MKERNITLQDHNTTYISEAKSVDNTMVSRINFSLNLLKQTPFYRKKNGEHLESKIFKSQIQRLENMQENGIIGLEKWKIPRNLAKYSITSYTL